MTAGTGCFLRIDFLSISSASKKNYIIYYEKETVTVKCKFHIHIRGSLHEPLALENRNLRTSSRKQKYLAFDSMDGAVSKHFHIK